MAFQWESVASKYDPLKMGSIDGTDTEPHDRAVIRAMNAKYKPNKGVQGDPEATIFVGRLNSNTTEETLRESFSPYGEIANIRLIRDFVTGFSKRYAFVEYESKHSAVKAYQEANYMVIDQHEILVDFEHCRTMQGWVPRRLGGGFGGKKESGQLRFGGRDRPFSKPIFLKTGERSNRNSNTPHRPKYSDYHRERNDYSQKRRYRDEPHSPERDKKKPYN